MQKQVLSLLNDLGATLQDAISISSGDKLPWDQLESDDDDNSHAGGENLADGTSHGRSSDEHTATDKQCLGEGLDDLPSSELEQIAEDINDIVKCLLRLSVAIRNPTPHDRFAAALPVEASSYEPWDIQHFRSKFTGVTDIIAERLGKAISDRRQYFKYRQSHREKLAHGLDVNSGESASKGSINEAISTLASSLPDHLKSKMANLSLDAVEEDAVSDAGISQTSFASTNADATQLRVPPLPGHADHGPFECPFCFTMVTVTSTIAWR